MGPVQKVENGRFFDGWVTFSKTLARFNINNQVISMCKIERKLFFSTNFYQIKIGSGCIHLPNRGTKMGQGPLLVKNNVAIFLKNIFACFWLQLKKIKIIWNWHTVLTRKNGLILIYFPCYIGDRKRGEGRRGRANRTQIDIFTHDKYSFIFS